MGKFVYIMMFLVASTFYPLVKTTTCERPENQQNSPFDPKFEDNVADNIGYLLGTWKEDPDEVSGLRTLSHDGTNDPPPKVSGEAHCYAGVSEEDCMDCLDNAYSELRIRASRQLCIASISKRICYMEYKLLLEDLQENQNSEGTVSDNNSSESQFE